MQSLAVLGRIASRAAPSAQQRLSRAMR